MNLDFGNVISLSLPLLDPEHRDRIAPRTAPK